MIPLETFLSVCIVDYCTRSRCSIGKSWQEGSAMVWKCLGCRFVWNHISYDVTVLFRCRFECIFIHTYLKTYLVKSISPTGDYNRDWFLVLSWRQILMFIFKFSVENSLLTKFEDKDKSIWLLNGLGKMQRL